MSASFFGRVCLIRNSAGNSTPTFFQFLLHKAGPYYAGTGRSFARATRTLWEIFRSHVQVVISTTVRPLNESVEDHHLLSSVDYAPLDSVADILRDSWVAPSSPRLQEKADYD